MTQFNFTTNIEKRMPDTGKVFCIDRMTSDYAQAHPLDADDFIESVYQEFAGTEFEENREVLHGVWTSVLSDMNPRGDASLYPYKNGAKRPAAIKVWHKAGDYWRRGLRLNDTLPDIVPMTKITRLDDGSWIALFPKDEHLLSDTQHQSEPRQLDLFAFEQLQQENERLQARIAQMKSQQRPERFTARRNQTQTVTATVPVGSPAGSDHEWLKLAGFAVAASVALLVIWNTGLIIPLGLIGLATSGFLK
jgi:hypothetical protein